MSNIGNALVYLGPGDPGAPSQREELIRQRAYFKAMQRQFAPGHELDDWLAAEDEVDAWLRRPRGASGA